VESGIVDNCLSVADGTVRADQPPAHLVEKLPVELLDDAPVGLLPALVQHSTQSAVCCALAVLQFSDICC
jgi:hypothetical protein